MNLGLTAEREWWKEFADFCANIRDWRTRLSLVLRARALRRAHAPVGAESTWPYLHARMPPLGDVPVLDDPRAGGLLPCPLRSPVAADLLDRFGAAADLCETQADVEFSRRLKQVTESCVGMRDALLLGIGQEIRSREAAHRDQAPCWSVGALSVQIGDFEPESLAGAWSRLRALLDAALEPEVDAGDRLVIRLGDQKHVDRIPRERIEAIWTGLPGGKTGVRGGLVVISVSSSGADQWRWRPP